MAQNEQTNGDFPEEVGAVWVKTAKASGKQFLSISVKTDLKAGAQLVAFKNAAKTKPNHPDFRIIASRPMEGAPAPAPAAPTETRRRTAAPAAKAEVEIPELQIT